MGVCDAHGEMFGSKSHSLYVTVVLSGLKYKRRLRICGDCRSGLSATFGDQWFDGFIIERFNENSACHGCGTVRGEDGVLHPLYATGFGSANKRYDYHAAYCEPCARSVISSLHLTEMGPNGER